MPGCCFFFLFFSIPFLSSLGSVQLLLEAAAAAGGAGLDLPALGDAIAPSWSSTFALSTDSAGSGRVYSYQCVAAAG